MYVGKCRSLARDQRIVVDGKYMTLQLSGSVTLRLVLIIGALRYGVWT